MDLNEPKLQSLENNVMSSLSDLSLSLSQTLSVSVCLSAPKGGWGYLSSSCLESQVCHLIPLSCLLSCFFSA